MSLTPSRSDPLPLPASDEGAVSDASVSGAMLNAFLYWFRDNLDQRGGRWTIRRCPSFRSSFPICTGAIPAVTATNRTVAPRLAGICAPPGSGRRARMGLRGSPWRSAAAAPARAGKPRIWHARRNDEMLAGLLLQAPGLAVQLIFTSAAQRQHTWITRFLIARMDAVIATSERRRRISERAGDGRASRRRSELYRPAGRPRARRLRRAACRANTRIGCFGRVRAQKGTDVFVEAMCALLPRYPDFSAVIVGSVTPRPRAFAAGLEAARRARPGLASGCVSSANCRSRRCRAGISASAIYAFTSRNEGFGLTLLEAMAAGVALVAARAGRRREGRRRRRNRRAGAARRRRAR